VSVACPGVIYSGQSGEVAAPRLHGWNAEGPVAAFGGGGPFPGGEEEKRVSTDWSADRAAVLIIDSLWGARSRGSIRVEKEILSSPLVVRVVFERDAMVLVRSRSRDHRNCRTAGDTLFGVEIVRGDVYGLDRFQRRYVQHLSLPGEHAGGSID